MLFLNQCIIDFEKDLS